MTYLAIISAALTAIFIGYMGYSVGHWDGYIKGYDRGRNDESVKGYTYTGSFGEHWENEDDDYWNSYVDEPEFKDHQLN